ncbi:MAG TPA: ferrochelatase [Holophagaceae bacterium]|nr:ferrochelatase [Holophagaceae bacterium]
MTPTAPDTAIVLLNLGGPVNLDQVEPFLFNLFADRELIKLPGPAWFQPTYAKGIARIRRKGAQKRYAEIGGGSPLLKESAAQAAGLRSLLRAAGRTEPVKLLFRYSQPRAEGMVRALKRQGITKLLPVTLYPHDCRATTGSSVRELERVAAGAGMTVLPGVLHYATDADYLDALEAPIRAALEELPYATVIFSAHSLPMKQIEAGDPYEREIQATCEALKARLGQLPGGYILAYQSRVGPIRWLEPNLRTVLKDCGGRDVIIVPISFVSEHIETLHELDIEYRHMSDQLGVRTYRRVPTPGVHPSYLKALLRRTLEVLP